MLKQSLVQERLSDLAVTNGTILPSTTKTYSKSAKYPASSNFDLRSNSLLSFESSSVSQAADTTHMPQWPRVHIGTQQIQSNLNTFNRAGLTTDNAANNNLTLTSSDKNPYKMMNYLPLSSSSSHGGIESLSLNSNNNESIEYDGIETVNYYSSKNYNNNFNENSQNNFSNPNKKNHTPKNPSNTNSGDNYDPTMKLRYLEKSIKFIQQQHNETLSSLHNEIENLKNENRDLHFQLATRKSSSSSSSSAGIQEISKSDTQHLLKHLTNDSKEHRDLEKLIREASAKEPDLNKRLNDIKVNYDQNKYETLMVKLKDAESKNEYLTSIINQLQSKRSVNSGYRPNVNVNNEIAAAAVNNSPNSKNNVFLNQKLNLNHIYTIEPLLIKVNDKDDPRTPSKEESESIVKKLFELYKQQKQQISNMKVVLKDMMHTENLSNQGMMITKDILENPNKFNQYFLDNKLSIITPITHSSNTILNQQNKYHSQLLASLNTNNLDLNALKINSNLNLASSIHLPPLQTINPAKFPERQRRTQILQKQRLRREYFH